MIETPPVIGRLCGCFCGRRPRDQRRIRAVRRRRRMIIGSDGAATQNFERCQEDEATGAPDHRTPDVDHGTQGVNHGTCRANGDTWEAGPGGAALRVTIRMSVTAVSPAITTNT